MESSFVICIPNLFIFIKQGIITKPFLWCVQAHSNLSCFLCTRNLAFFLAREQIIQILPVQDSTKTWHQYKQCSGGTRPINNHHNNTRIYIPPFRPLYCFSSFIQGDLHGEVTSNPQRGFYNTQRSSVFQEHTTFPGGSFGHHYGHPSLPQCWTLQQSLYLSLHLHLSRSHRTSSVPNLATFSILFGLNDSSTL